MGLNYQRRNRLFSIFFILALVLMATLLLRSPSGFMSYMLLAVPYTFLIGFWISFRGVNQQSGKVEHSLPEEGRAAFRGLQESISLQTVFGIAGIAIALAIGWSMGSLTASTERRGGNDYSLTAVNQLHAKKLPAQTWAATSE